MGRTRTPKPAKREATLMVRLDHASKAEIAKAAELRRISVSDYVRSVMLEQARREIAGAAQGVIVMTPDEQLAFWNALNAPPTLTPAQKELAEYIRGER